MKMASHKACLAAVLLLALVGRSDAASLRATPVAAPKTATTQAAPKPVKEAPVKASDAAAEQVAATLMKALGVNASAHVGAEKTQGAVAAAGPVKHEKLDFGFQDFEKNLTEEISLKLLKSASGTAWNDDMRTKFSKDVIDALKESLKVTLKPVKQSIGKTWMALPQDAQKDEYVTSLKSSFESVFAKSMETVDSHLEISLKRIEALSKEKSSNSTELLNKAQFTVKDSMLTEHCYEVGAKKNLKLTKKANASEVQADKKKFCIQSVIGALAHRLNDTQGLISMSMRFEAGAMSALQKKTKDATVTHQLKYTA